MGNDDFWKLITIDDNEAVPKYRQLQAELERLIAESVLKVNARLPGENEFFSQLGLSRTTIRKAFAALEKNHLLYRVQGQGTFIGSKPPSASRNSDNARPDDIKQVIGVVVPNITNEIYPFIIHGVEETVSLSRVCVFSANSGGSRERELRILNEMINNSVDGLILEPIYSDSDRADTRLVSLLESLSIPVVLLNNDIPSFECSKVMQDDEGGGRLVTEHMLERGHKRIAYIYNDRISAACERRKGYRAALNAAGVGHDPELEIAYNDEEGLVYPGYLLTKALLEKPELGVTAIFYFNDDLALQGMTAAQSLNMEIPRDLSIAGYDDIPRSRLNGVRLTTVSHPKKLIGAWAATLLQEQFEQTDIKPIYRKITVHSSMVYRDTVAAPKKNI
jgi:GntR family transcriptional regulator of arabinose operon